MKNKKNDLELIVQSNSLIEAHYKLSPFAQLLLRRMISMIKPNDTHFEKYYYRISVDDIAELTGRNIDGIYEDVKRASRQLLRATISIPKSQKQWLSTTWLASIEYHGGEGWFEFEFSTKLEKELLKLKKEFTQYYLKNISELNSQYSIRIYEILKQYLKVNFRRVELKELRRMMGIENKIYKRFNDFRRKVLDKAEEEVCEKTDLCFKWKPLKTGRKITSIEFYIYKKSESEKKELSELPEKILFLIPEEHRSSVKEICLKILSDRGEHCLAWIIEYVNTKQKHKNYGGYIRFAYENGLYEHHLEQKRLEEEFLKEQLKATVAKKNAQQREIKANQEAIERESYLNELINNLSPEEEDELNQLALKRLESDAKTKEGYKQTLDRYWKYFNSNKKERALKCLYQYRLKLIEDFKAEKGVELPA